MSINVPLLKLAARAWKQNHLSEYNRSKLERAGILNYDKELAGLTLGSDNIAKDKNVVETYTPNSNRGNTGIADVEYRNENHTKETFVPHEPVAKLKYQIEYGDISPASLVRTHRKSTGEAYKPDEWAKQLVRRHELDEVAGIDRTMQKTMKKQLGKTYKPATLADAMYDKEKVDSVLVSGVEHIKKNKVYSHVNPEVLRRESGHLAGAPAHMREDFSALRSYRPNSRTKLIPGTMTRYGRLPSTWDSSAFISEQGAVESAGLRYGTQAKANTRKSFDEVMRSTITRENAAGKRRFINMVSQATKPALKGLRGVTKLR